MSDRYAVFGNPIEHSKSPIIHKLFAEQTGEDIQYEKQLVDVDGFAEATNLFFSDGGKGLNITVPFKLEAYQYANQLTRRARQAGAVNTLAKQADGTILGDNTDGIGMVNDMLHHLAWVLNEKRILVLGAGGAVRGVLGPLLENNPQQIVIANRTIEKAEQLAQAFCKQGNLTAKNFSELKNEKFDIVINGTSASLAGELPPLPEQLLDENACCYDMMYGKEPTVFMQWAEKNHCQNIADGLGMLVGQAAESFFLWRGVRPNVEGVIAALKIRL